MAAPSPGVIWLRFTGYVSTVALNGKVFGGFTTLIYSTFAVLSSSVHTCITCVFRKLCLNIVKMTVAWLGCT